ncbi:hypothetical protein Scep_008464 [Stephania cephalantha]|uniref:Protein kinase domain-containing protein n=1 Tax=Stephania cephalantha TaxID=152367 RepID=A0AAP0PMR1_9MAGN
MESKKAKIIAALVIIALVAILIICRVFLRHSSSYFFILGADIGGIFAVLTWVVVQHRMNRKRELLERQLVSEGRELRIEYSFLRKVAGLPIKFQYKDLESATDEFKALLGRGASACVFKGILDDGTHVAVKRIEGAENGEKAFRAEVAAIASVQHVNLVHLLGYCCVPEGPRFLVYEYVPNGSLDAWIFPQKEIVGGRRNVHLVEDNSQRKWSYFPRFVAEKFKQGKLMEVVDERLVNGGEVDENQVRLLVQVALWCIQEDSRLRPSMNEVVDMLEWRIEVQDPPETEMIIVDILSIDQDSTNAPCGARIAQPIQPSHTHPRRSLTCSFSLSILSGR